MKRSILFIAFFALFCGCGGGSNIKSDTLLRSSATPKPQWVDNMGAMKRPGAMSFTGRSSGAGSERDAIELATRNAFSNLSNYFGVSVKSDMISSERESDGVYSYSIGIESKITGAAISVKRYNIDATYTEQWNRGRREYDAAILLTVPDIEMVRIKAEVEGAVSWAVMPRENVVRSNSKVFIQELARRRGVNFRQTDIELPDILNHSDIFNTYQTAFLLVIKCDIGEPQEYHGEWYVSITTTVEFTSLIENRIVDTWKIEERGGAFDPERAIDNGMKQTFKKLISKL